MTGDSRQYEKIVNELFSAEMAKHVHLDIFKIFHDKKYRGNSGHEHQIDVSAHLKVAGVEVIVLVECKKYSRSVGVDDVMELATRLQDIGAHKGIIVTTKGFQAGAIRIATSKGNRTGKGVRPWLDALL